MSKLAKKKLDDFDFNFNFNFSKKNNANSLLESNIITIIFCMTVITVMLILGHFYKLDPQIGVHNDIALDYNIDNNSIQISDQIELNSQKINTLKLVFNINHQNPLSSNAEIMALQKKIMDLQFKDQSHKLIVVQSYSNISKITQPSNYFLKNNPTKPSLTYITVVQNTTYRIKMVGKYSSYIQILKYNITFDGDKIIDIGIDK